MTKTKKLVMAGVFLGLALLFPFLTGQIQTFGQMLAPMHIPVLLAGFALSPWYAAAIGFIAPLLRSLLFAMPPMYPVALAMAFELAAYGALASIMYRTLKKTIPYIYITLILSMLGGRAIYGIVMLVISSLTSTPYTFEIFLTKAFADSLLGIALQLVVIPALVLVMKKLKLICE